MEITCPKCGESIPVNGLGRKKKNIPVKKITDALKLCYTIKGAAELLEVSRGYIYKMVNDPKSYLRPLRG